MRSFSFVLVLTTSSPIYEMVEKQVLKNYLKPQLGFICICWWRCGNMSPSKAWPFCTIKILSLPDWCPENFVDHRCWENLKSYKSKLSRDKMKSIAGSCFCARLAGHQRSAPLTYKFAVWKIAWIWPRCLESPNACILVLTNSPVAIFPKRTGSKRSYLCLSHIRIGAL